MVSQYGGSQESLALRTILRWVRFPLSVFRGPCCAAPELRLPYAVGKLPSMIESYVIEEKTNV